LNNFVSSGCKDKKFDELFLPLNCLIENQMVKRFEKAIAVVLRFGLVPPFIYRFKSENQHTLLSKPDGSGHGVQRSKANSRTTLPYEKQNIHFQK